jgi:DeoR family transcriptional regulator, fructose operon transcriptional repressor
MAVTNNRKTNILKEIEKLGTVSVADLAVTLEVSEMTIRRMLTELENDGLIKKVHGGAVSGQGRSYEPPYILRAIRSSELKIKIGSAAVQLVDDGDCIAIDVGTTTAEFAKKLQNKHNLTIMTPSLRIANILINNKDIRLILPGGIVRQGEESLVGDLIRQAFNDLFVDKLFLAVGCIDADKGFTEYNLEDVLVKRIMISSAKEVIVLADSTKFGHVAFAQIASFNQINILVTDAEPPELIKKKLIENGVKIIIA